MDPNAETIRARVREQYGETAKTVRLNVSERGGCCAPSDYSLIELDRVPKDSFLGEGSGNPVRHAGLIAGEVVVDLGSGAGVDVFLAADRVGPTGRAIGVDMTPEMIQRAQQAAAEAGVNNVEFHPGIIEELPLPSRVADVVVSNCVINLSPDKAAVFREAFRVLKPGGRLVISDIVQERPLGIIDDECRCVPNAMVRSEYIATIQQAGFRDVAILDERAWRVGPTGVDASSVTVRAIKPMEVSP